MKAATERYSGLDGLRGVAALIVGFYHFTTLGTNFDYVPYGFLAVDLFFCLSGYVIAHAYESRLLAGLSPYRFIVIRLVRLYPFYLLGLLIGVIKFFVYRSGYNDPVAQHLSWQSFITTFGLNLLFLPGPVTSKSSLHTNFAFNVPAWSLFLELAINIVYAFAVRFLRRIALGLTIGIFAVLLVVEIHHAGANLGYARETLYGGFLRCGYSFFTGVLLYRLRAHQRTFALSRRWLWVALVLLLGFGIPGPADTLYQTLVILFALPAIVWFAASPQRVEAVTGRFEQSIADCSYGLYAVHHPCIIIFIVLTPGLSARAGPAMYALFGVLLLACILVFVQAAYRYYDVPVRAALKRFTHT